MKMRQIQSYTGRASGSAAAASLLIMAGMAWAGSAVSFQETLPPVEKVMAQYIEAIGGQPAMEKIHNRVSRGTMEITGSGIKFQVTVYQARPIKSHSIIESDVTGRIENGTDGSVAWQIAVATGPQVMEGKEKVSFLHSNTFDRLAYWRKVYAQAKVEGVEDVAGRSCYKVAFTPPGLAPQTMYFDRESHLLARVEMIVESPAGSMPTDSYLSDYQPVDGVMLPHKTVSKLMNQERIATIESIQQNVELPPGIFDLPPEIKALIK